MMTAGITDHLSTNASPPLSSSAKTIKFVTMMETVRTGKCTGRRDASVNGINPPTCPPLSHSVYKVGRKPRRRSPVSADVIQGLANLLATVRAAKEIARRVVPLNSMLIPTNVPMIHPVLDGHVLQIITGGSE